MSIYTLKLHESLHLPYGGSIVRVPGGWIYTRYTEDDNATSVFVPYDNEFDDRDQSPF